MGCCFCWAASLRLSYSGLALKQLLKLQKVMPAEVMCQMETDASEESGSLAIARDYLEKYAGSSAASKERSPNSEQAFVQASDSVERL